MIFEPPKNNIELMIWIVLFPYLFLLILIQIAETTVAKIIEKILW